MKFIKVAIIIITMVICSFTVNLCAFATQTHNTDVTLTIEDMAYILTIPSNTALATDGTTTALTNGLTVSNGKLALGRRLDITVSSGNSWKLKNETATTNKEISYALYANATDLNSNTLWSFTRDEANTANPGTTKQIYAAPKVNEVYLAEAGTYKDVITFTAEIHTSLYPLQSEDRTFTVELNVEGCATWQDVASKAENLAIGINNRGGYYQMYYVKDSVQYEAFDAATGTYLDTQKAYSPSDSIYLHK